jgi:hypothetical protein
MLRIRFIIMMPAVMDGVPVRMQIIYPLKFTLN